MPTVTRSEPAPRRAGAAAPRQSLVEELGERLAQEIMDGRLLPGARLEEVQLAGRFGVSRTPVREALRHLAATGLVQKRPNRGVVVTSITRAQLEQMFEAMAELEAVAARLAALRMTAAERTALREMHEGAADLVRRGDHRAYETFNRRFHLQLYEGSHNAEIIALAAGMRRRVAPFRRAQFLVPGRVAASFAEHATVVEHVVAGEADRAAAAMRAHLQLVGDASALLLDASTAGGRPDADAPAADRAAPAGGARGEPRPARPARARGEAPQPVAGSRRS